MMETSQDAKPSYTSIKEICATSAQTRQYPFFFNNSSQITPNKIMMHRHEREVIDNYTYKIMTDGPAG